MQLGVIFRIVATAGYELVSRGKEELESLAEEATYGEKDYLGVYRQEDNSQSRTVGDHLKRNTTALLLTRYTRLQARQPSVYIKFGTRGWMLQNKDFFLEFEEV